MARSRKTKEIDLQPGLFDLTLYLRTAPCVPALRKLVAEWRDGGYQGVTHTTRTLLNYWFFADHKLPNGQLFKYHDAQREAIETLMYVYEVAKVRSRKDLLEHYVPAGSQVRLPAYDEFARYCTKMATGSGKTKVMSLAIAWQYFNAVRENEDDYAKTFLIIAPNVIVYERLKSDFEGGRIFNLDPLIPRELKISWEFDCVMRGDAERAPADGMLFLTNIQQLYDRTERKKNGDDEPDIMTEVLGPKPKDDLNSELTSFAEMLAKRAGQLLVLNDEAHHTHEEENEWNEVIRRLHASLPLAAQLDFSATPRFTKGALFPWVISDYPIKQAILDGIVKRPVKGVADFEEARSDVASVRYRVYLTAGVERWREYREQLAPMSKKPVLFIMMNTTEEAEDVGDWLRKTYPSEFGGDNRALVIHTDKSGEISKKDLDAARKLAREVDSPECPTNAIVSVLMLREGWDAQNVTVVVGLRPYTAKANILPEQAIGRGLRLMFRDLTADYTERVDIIGNQKFLDFVDDLEKLEDLKLDTFELGKDPVRILTIMPLAERKEFDIGLPVLSPTLVRKKSLADEIASLEVMTFQTMLLPLTADDPNNKTFRYEGHDIITLQKIVERDYKVPEPQTAQELIGYYARRIAEAVKLPSQFAALAPKIRDFFENKAFGRWVDLNDMVTVRAMATQVASYVCIQEFSRVLKQLSIADQEPQLLEPARMLSACQPFPWSRKVLEANKCVFNMVPCDNDLEKEFARFLENADDVRAFAKLPQPFGFSIDYTDAGMNLRSYYPDFVATDKQEIHWLIETKGMETTDVGHKDIAATNWCENATALTKAQWKYAKIQQKGFEVLQPSRLADLAALGVPSLVKG